MAIYPYIGSRVDRLTGACELEDSGFSGRDFVDYYFHLSQRRSDELRRTGLFRVDKKEWPARAIEIATIRTTYIPIYRIQTKQYFSWGLDFANNWNINARKLNNPDRYSPIDTAGFYFGLTLKAAEDEIRYYSGGEIDPAKYMILVMEACFDNILYLPAALGAVWQAAELDCSIPISEQFLLIMDPNTNNEITNQIGRWARSEGFSGILYPTARYGSEEWLTRHLKEGIRFHPAMNFVDVGSHLCPDNFTQQASTLSVIEAMRVGSESGKKVIPIFAEMNIVLFDGSQLSGHERGVIYQTYPLNMRSEVLSQDDSARQSVSYTWFLADDWPEWLKGS